MASRPTTSKAKVTQLRNTLKNGVYFVSRVNRSGPSPQRLRLGNVTDVKHLPLHGGDLTSAQNTKIFFKSLTEKANGGSIALSNVDPQTIILDEAQAKAWHKLSEDTQWRTFHDINNGRQLKPGTFEYVELPKKITKVDLVETSTSVKGLEGRIGDLRTRINDMDAVLSLVRTGTSATSEAIDLLQLDVGSIKDDLAALRRDLATAIDSLRTDFGFATAGLPKKDTKPGNGHYHASESPL